LHQVIELPLTAERIAELEREVAGYEFVQWREHTPPRWLEQLAAALAGASRDTPHGELEQEVGRWTPERIVEVEARRIKQGRFCHTTAAIASDGRLAAYTQMGGAAANPERLYQWDTFVWPEHRGRGLGMAVKVPNLRSLQAELAQPAVLHTWNAPENAPMIRVNDRLGFRAVDRRTNWELAL